MPTPRNMAPAALAALAYVTAGALILVWSTVAAVYYYRHPPEDDRIFYLGAGVLATGFILLAIGLGIGWIGRGARHADLRLRQRRPRPPPPPPRPEAATPHPLAA